MSKSLHQGFAPQYTVYFDPTYIFPCHSDLSGVVYFLQKHISYNTWRFVTEAAINRS